MKSATDEFYKHAERMNANEEQKMIERVLNKKFAMVKQINDKIMNERLPITDRISAIRMVRNNPYHVT